MQREIQIGAIAWQSGIPSPLLAPGVDLALQPAWAPRVYLVQKATSNPAPPTELGDFRAFQEGRHYRALSWCRCRVEMDEETGALLDFQIDEAIHDPGWTPPMRFAECPPALSAALHAHQTLRDPDWRPGENSAISGIAAVGHRHSALQGVPEGATVLVHALVKCRPARRADEAHLALGSPYHMPWIWNEWLLAHTAGKLTLYMRGSKYPSHAWYVDGRQVLSVAGLADAVFHEEPDGPEMIRRGPLVTFRPPRKGKWIHLSRLALYPAVLSKGAPADEPQSANGEAEVARLGPVSRHPHTVDGWRTSALLL